MNATLPLEWFFETINKRLGEPYNCKLEDIFCVVPYPDEAEFDFEFTNIFKRSLTRAGISQGNALRHDYPNIAKLVLNSNHTLKIKVFFISPRRLRYPLLLWHKKYPYPKISQVNGIRSELVFDTDVNRARIENHLKQSLLAKYQ